MHISCDSKILHLKSNRDSRLCGMPTKQPTWSEKLTFSFPEANCPHGTQCPSELGPLRDYTMNGTVAVWCNVKFMYNCNGKVGTMSWWMRMFFKDSYWYDDVCMSAPPHAWKIRSHLHSGCRRYYSLFRVTYNHILIKVVQLKSV